VSLQLETLVDVPPVNPGATVVVALPITLYDAPDWVQPNADTALQVLASTATTITVKNPTLIPSVDVSFYCRVTHSYQHDKVHGPLFWWQGGGSSGGGGGTPLQTGGFLAVTLGAGGFPSTGTITLTAPQAQNQIVTVSGVLTGDVTIQVPNTPGMQFVFANIATGAHNLNLQPVGGTGINAVPQNTVVRTYVDDTSTLQSY